MSANFARRLNAAEGALARRFPLQSKRTVHTVVWHVGESWADTVADLTVTPGDDVMVYQLVGMGSDPVRERDRPIASAWLAERRGRRP